ncbi:MAG: hypothetical protein JWM90_208 [Thermoleophilia bacterium]|nr:hypothetical protein [Thermoleophilia bacterium]
MTSDTTLDAAADEAMAIRALYHQLERTHEGQEWSTKDDMLGLVNDVGTLSRLVMAAGGQWLPEGDIALQTKDKLAESLWWILVLARRLDIDIDAAFADKMQRIDAGLRDSIARTH